jgi:hypothetical protein
VLLKGKFDCLPFSNHPISEPLRFGREMIASRQRGTFDKGCRAVIGLAAPCQRQISRWTRFTFAPGATIELVEIATSSSYFVCHQSQKRDNVDFNGADMITRPNNEAVVDSAGKFWPHVHPQFRELELRLAAHCSGPSVRDLASEKESKLPAPYRMGATPNQWSRLFCSRRVLILKGLSGEVPVLSGQPGFEDLALAPDNPTRSAANRDKWLPATWRVSDPRAAAMLAATARRQVRKRSDWSIPGSLVLAVDRAPIEKRGSR